jgi:hypothetical protein
MQKFSAGDAQKKVMGPQKKHKNFAWSESNYFLPFITYFLCIFQETKMKFLRIILTSVIETQHKTRPSKFADTVILVSNLKTIIKSKPYSRNRPPFGRLCPDIGLFEF